MTNVPSVSIIMPALNEARNIADAIQATLAAFTTYGIQGEIIVINDGSTDATAQVVEGIISQYPLLVRMRTHMTPQGIGASFWDGVRHAKNDIVCMLPGDNENDPLETLRYVGLLNHVDIVIPFVYNRWVRLRMRNVISGMYRGIINTTFGVNLNYTNGTVMYRTSILQDLPQETSGFFFQTDILIRLLKKGYLFAEVPYRLGVRAAGKSKAISMPSLIAVMKGYLQLVKDVCLSKKYKDKGEAFSHNSISRQRYSEDLRKLKYTR